MRFHQVAVTALSMAALASCKSDNITTPSRPPLAGVRFINALSDTNSVDMKMVDQVEWSPVANNIAYRAGTEHQAIEAKSRHIKVFAFVASSPTIGNVSQVLLDTNVTFTANSKVTMLLTGSARAKTVRFVMISDDVAAPGASQIAVKTVNASTGAIDVYYTTAPADPITGAPSAPNVAPLGASASIVRATGAVAAQVTPAGTTAVSASGTGPPAPAGAAGTAPAAGVNSAGSAFSVYYFPRGVAGSPQNGVATPTVTWFVDRVPTP